MVLKYKYTPINDNYIRFNIEELKKTLIKNGYCPHCIYKTGKLEYKEGKKGKFLGCSNYPECRYAQFDKE